MARPLVDRQAGPDSGGEWTRPAYAWSLSGSPDQQAVSASIPLPFSASPCSPARETSPRSADPGGGRIYLWDRDSGQGAPCAELDRQSGLGSGLGPPMRSAFGWGLERERRLHAVVRSVPGAAFLPDAQGNRARGASASQETGRAFVVSLSGTAGSFVALSDRQRPRKSGRIRDTENWAAEEPGKARPPSRPTGKIIIANCLFSGRLRLRWQNARKRIFGCEGHTAARSPASPSLPRAAAIFASAAADPDRPYLGP